MAKESITKQPSFGMIKSTVSNRLITFNKSPIILPQQEQPD
jgi:hypothetical protein